MLQGENTATGDDADVVGARRPVPNGKVNVEESGEEEIPRVKGLIELIQRYLDAKKASGV